MIIRGWAKGWVVSPFGKIWQGAGQWGRSFIFYTLKHSPGSVGYVYYSFFMVSYMRQDKGIHFKDTFERHIVRTHF